MQLLRSYPWICEQMSALTIRCSIILYLVKSIACQPYTTHTMIRNGSYYMNGDIVCLKCPAGTFVKKDCVISNTQGICQTCNPGVTYSEYQTGLNHCLTCTRCRADQEEISSCNITKNTICQCKNGTYCPTTSPCYECLPCRSSCPVEQVLQHACNVTSDIVCAPVTTHLSHTVWIFVISIFIIASSAVVFLYLFKYRPFKILTFNHGETPAQDIERPFLPERTQLRFKGNLPENHKIDAISKIFNHFLELVPTKEFETFVQELGLTNNEIDGAKHDNTDTYNQHYAMLLKLHQKKKCDVNIWLNKLYEIKMEKVAEIITEKLTRDGLCETSTQG